MGSSVRRSVPVLFVALVALLSGCKSAQHVASSSATTAVGSKRLTELSPDKLLAQARRTANGEPVMRVSGEQRGALFVSVRTGLPVSYSESTPDSSTDGTFSTWGTPVVVRAPKGAMPFASVPR